MASAMMRRSTATLRSVMGVAFRDYASVSVGLDIVSAAPDVSLQKARTWDEGLSSKFSTTPLSEIFKVLFLSSFEFVVLRVMLSSALVVDVDDFDFCSAGRSSFSVFQ
ncbi:hypothetical protein Droror1_Dr00025914 [Drosera rotundifolia]